MLLRKWNECKSLKLIFPNKIFVNGKKMSDFRQIGNYSFFSIPVFNVKLVINLWDLSLLSLLSSSSNDKKFIVFTFTFHWIGINVVCVVLFLDGFLFYHCLFIFISFILFFKSINLIFNLKWKTKLNRES